MWSDHGSNRHSGKRIGGRGRATVAVLAACVALYGCGRNTVSGEYVASSPTEVDRMQLVETPDKHLNGQLEISLLKPDGHIEYETFAVSGATDGSNVSLTLKPPVPLSSAVEVSGTLAGGRLALTGGSFGAQSSSFTLAQADEAAYQNAMSTLRSQSAQILKARAIAQAKAAEAAAREKALSDQRTVAAEIDQLADRMGKINAAATAYLEKFSAVAAHYRDITSRMEGYLARERSLAGDQTAFAARNQLMLTINQGTLATYQLHSQVEQLRLNFESGGSPMTESAEAAKRYCGNAVADAVALQTVCRRFLNVLPAYIRMRDDMAAGLSGLEATYQSEEQKQRDLQTAAQQIN